MKKYFHIQWMKSVSKYISILSEERFPISAIVEDFQKFDLIVAVDESEHRPLMEKRFFEWLDNIEYWLIHDINKEN